MTLISGVVMLLLSLPAASKIEAKMNLAHDLLKAESAEGMMALLGKKSLKVLFCVCVNCQVGKSINFRLL